MKWFKMKNKNLCGVQTKMMLSQTIEMQSKCGILRTGV